MKGIPRVYFQYCYSVDGKKYTECDYLDHVNEILEFVPNAYFLLEKPVFEERPIHRYKNEKKRILEIKRRNKALLARKAEILKEAEAKAKAAGEEAKVEKPIVDEFNIGEFKVEKTKVKGLEPNYPGTMHKSRNLFNGFAC